MSKKTNIEGGLNISYFLYITFLISIINGASKLGILGKDNIVYEISEKINYVSLVGVGSTLFFIMFFGVMFFITKSEKDEIQIFEDDNIEKKIKNKLLLYKIIIILTVIVFVYMMIYSKDIDLMANSVFLMITSLLMYYIKDAHLKVSLYDRKRIWHAKCNYGDYSMLDINTKRWRNKIWFNKVEKISFKYRFMNILDHLPTIIIASIFILRDHIIIYIIMGYLIIANLIPIIENLFGIFTSINGVCTDVAKISSRNSSYYKVTVTDYENKREISVNINDSYGIEEMDRLEVVHGIFSKRCIAINNVINKPNTKKLKSTYITLFVIFAIFVGTFITYSKEENTYYNDNLGYSDNNSNYDIGDNEDNQEYDGGKTSYEYRYQKKDIINLYNNINKNNIKYEPYKEDIEYVESAFNTFEYRLSMEEKYIVSYKRHYVEVLNKYSYDSFYDNVVLDLEEAKELSKRVLPKDIKEERVLVNNSSGKEAIVYSSSEGTFVVDFGKSSIFIPDVNRDVYNENEVVSIKYLKLVD